MQRPQPERPAVNCRKTKPTHAGHAATKQHLIAFAESAFRHPEVYSGEGRRLKMLDSVALQHWYNFQKPCS